MSLPVIKLTDKRPQPVEVTAVTRPFWDGLSSGQFLVIACTQCERISFPPRVVCPRCLCRELEWQPVSGRGILYALTTVHKTPPVYGFSGPVNVVIVDLEEGVRLLTQLLPGTGTAALDSQIQLVITEHPDGYHYAARSVSSPG